MALGEDHRDMSIFNKIKRVFAAAVRPFGTVVDNPPVAADGEDSPLRVHGTTRGVFVHVSNAADIGGGGGGGGEVTQGDGSGTEAGFWTVRLSNGSAFIPFPTALQGSRFATASTLTDGTNAASILNTAPTSEYGVVTRNIPSGTQAVSGTVAASQSGTWSITNISAAAALSDSTANPTTGMIGSAVMGFSTPGFGAGGSVWKRIAGNEVGLTVQGYTANGGSAGQYNPLTVAGTTSSNVVARLITDSSGRLRVVTCRNIVADGTTDAPTRFPASGDFIAFSSGVAIVKATTGRLFGVDIHYTGATASGLYVQLHNAASATTPTTSTIIKSWPINVSAYQIERDFDALDLCFSAGIKVVFSSTRLTTSIATTETGAVVAWGA